MIRRLILALSLLLPVVSSAQSVEDIKALFETSASSFEFTYRTMSKTPLTVKGKVLISGGCYHLETGMMEVFCDSAVRVTLDHDAKEAYAERPDGAAAFWAAPQLFLPDVENLSVGKDWIKGTYRPKDGEAAEFSFFSMAFKPSVDVPESSFSFDLSSLKGSDWVVTDLR